MTTQPTDQLAKWREDAFDFWLKDQHMHATTTSGVAYRSGYLRRCQETEQAMKLAKFGAMVLSAYKEGYVSDEEIGNFALSSGCITQPIEAFAPNIESTIKELLK